MSGRSTAGLSPQAEPLAHDLSSSLLSRTTELLRARQRLCPVGRQGGSKRSKSLASWRVCYWDSSINFQERSILCTLPIAFPNILQTATTAPATAPPAARNSHRSNSSHPTCSGPSPGGRAIPKHAITLGYAHLSSPPFQLTNHQLRLPSSAIFFQPEVGQSN